MILLLVPVVVAVCLWCRKRRRDEERQTITGEQLICYKYVAPQIHCQSFANFPTSWAGTFVARFRYIK